MCGSSNVSSAAEVQTEAPEESEDENAKLQNFKTSAGPTQRVTLTEGMNIGDEPAAKPVKKSCKACKICISLAVVLLLLAAAAVAAFFFHFK